MLRDQQADCLSNCLQYVSRQNTEKKLPMPTISEQKGCNSAQTGFKPLRNQLDNHGKMTLRADTHVEGCVANVGEAEDLLHCQADLDWHLHMSGLRKACRHTVPSC